VQYEVNVVTRAHHRGHLRGVPLSERCDIFFVHYSVQPQYNFDVFVRIIKNKEAVS